MATITINWDEVTTDDTGAPMTVSEYRVLEDVAGVETLKALVDDLVFTASFVENTPGAHNYVVRATNQATGVPGNPSAPITLSVPSGVAAAPGNVTGSVS